MLFGLTSAKGMALNGSVGTVVDFGFTKEGPHGNSWDPDSGLYTIKLDPTDGEAEERVLKISWRNVDAA